MSTATKAARPATPGIEHKASSTSPDVGLLGADDATGVVEAIVSVTGVCDHDNDIIEPGAYAKTLANRRPKGIFVHDWAKWVARTEHIEELLPGDARLPKTTKGGAPWPVEAGGLYVKARFNLNTDEGRNAYHNVKFFSETGECEWSVGYRVPPGKSTKDKTGVRRIKEMDLFEYSPVLFGANSMSGTLAVKSAITTTVIDEQERDDQDMPEDPFVDGESAEGADASDDGDAQEWDDLEEVSGQVEDDDLPDAPQVQPEQAATAPADLEADETESDEGKSLFEIKPPPLHDPYQAVFREFRDLNIPEILDSTMQERIKRALFNLREANGNHSFPEAHAALTVLLGELRSSKNPEIRSFTDGAAALLRRAGEATTVRFVTKQDSVDGEEKRRDRWTRDSIGRFAETPGGASQPDPDSFEGNQVADETRDTGTTSPLWDEIGYGGDRGKIGKPAMDNGWNVAKAANNNVVYRRGEERLSVDFNRAPTDGANRLTKFSYGHWMSSDDYESGEERNLSLGRVLDFLKNPPPEPRYEEDSLAVDDLDGKMAHESLNRSPKRNWVEKAGQLPAYIQHIAKDIHEKRGLPLSQAIPIAIAAVKRWAVGGDDVNSQTRAKAVKAVAEWEKLKAASRAKKDEAPESIESGRYPFLPGTFEELRDQLREEATKMFNTYSFGNGPAHVEVIGTWPSHAVVTAYSTDGKAQTFELPYTLTVGDEAHPATLVLERPEPVILTVSVDGDDDAEAGEKMLPWPSMIEEATTGLKTWLLHTEVKAGRVLSGVNERRLLGAVESLVAVLKAAGLEINTKPKHADKDEQAANAAAQPLQMSDSTAPSARVETAGVKQMVDPQMMARAYRIIAEAAARRATE